MAQILFKIVKSKSFYFNRHLNLRQIMCGTGGLTYKPREPDAKEKLKHKFVPCCEMLMTPIQNLDLLKVNPQWTQPKVVIIGAGMAGLSAAAVLINAGITNLVVLEAKNRFGGRIHTCNLGEMIVELGADYIEGGSVANPVYNLACTGRVILCTPERYSTLPGHYVTSYGRAIFPTPQINNIMQAILYDAAKHFTSKRKDIKKLSLLDFISNKLNDAVKVVPTEEKDNFILISNGFLNQLRARWGDDLSVMSLEHYGSHICVPGGLIRIPRGAQTLLEPLLQEIPSGCFKLSKPVQCIRWGTSALSEPRAIVLCCDGTEVEADYVICTVSLGVLKEQAEIFFSPNLPEYKLNAINNLGYGCVNKIFIEYAKPFWVKSEGAKIKLAWTTDQLNARDNWVKGISVIEEVIGRGNVLMCTVSGKEAIWTENISNSQLAEDVTVFLRQVTGDPTIPCPTNINRSKWATDVHFHGSRTYMKVGSLIKHLCDLADPLPGVEHEVPPVLLFAGEATSPGHFSTMQGARFSGIREAQRIIRLTLKLQGPPKPPLVKSTTIPPCDSPDSFSPTLEATVQSTQSEKL